MPDRTVRVTVEPQQVEVVCPNHGYDGGELFSRSFPCRVCGEPLNEPPERFLATPTPETAAKLADGEKWRAQEAKLTYAQVVEYLGLVPSPTPRPSPDTEGGNG